MDLTQELLDSIEPIGNFDDEFIKHFYDDVSKLLKSILERQRGQSNTIDLTEPEKFLIAVVAGCEIVSHCTRNNCKEGCSRSSTGLYHFETYYPCGIAWNGQKFIVAQQISKDFRNIS